MEANQSNQHNSLLASEADSQRTLDPYVTGTSVVAIKYEDGILMASDMGGSYGSTLRYKSVERIKPIGKHSLLGASGEISDFQEILRYLDELILYDNMWDDGNSLGPKEVHSYLTRVMYNRRNKFNPLWNSLILGGVKNGHKYLGMVSMIGVNFEDDHIATGFGNHLARPILRDEWHENLSFEDGVKLLEKCMRVLLYRDRSAINKLQIAKITEEGVTVSQPYSLKTFWGFSAFQNPSDGAEESRMTLIPVESVSSYDTRQRKYEVYLGFQGVDTGINYYDHLPCSLFAESLDYALLGKRMMISTFIDDEKLQRESPISQTLKVIEDSKISVIILSSGYAFSTSCLRKLVEILKCREEKGQIVLPVFYRVKRSDVREQKGSFEEAFVEHEKRFKENLEQVQAWRSALTEVANLPGWDLQKWNESEVIIEQIVEKILNTIPDPFLLEKPKLFELSEKVKKKIREDSHA